LSSLDILEGLTTGTFTFDLLTRRPSCGKRFGVRWLAKKFVDEEEIPRGFAGSSGSFGKMGWAPT